MAQPALWTTRHRIQVDNVTIAYQTIGDGPPLVLIHGLAGSASWWRHNIADLATHFRLYLIDLIGFGASRGRQRFMLTRAASQIATWMRLVGIPRASLIGHSMGGLIVTDLAAAWPEQIDRMILLPHASLSSPKRGTTLCGSVQSRLIRQC